MTKLDSKKTYDISYQCMAEAVKRLISKNHFSIIIVQVIQNIIQTFPLIVVQYMKRNLNLNRVL